MLQRVRRAEGPKESKLESELSVNDSSIKSILSAAETDPTINRHETIYPYIEAYKKQGVDIQGWYDAHRKTSAQEVIKDNFVHNKELMGASKLAESLPLFANKTGRLGDYLSASVTKTAKQDDQGNSFIDLVIEVSNKWLTTDAPSNMQDVPAKMTFLVDVTTAYGDSFDKKVNALRGIYLTKGEKANVKCYKDANGNLGTVRPKVIVSKTSDYLERVGTTLGDCITQTAGDKFIINKPQIFDKEYQAYFLDLMESIAQNATENINYMKELPPDPKRLTLINDYRKIVNFVEAYKKTPTERVRTA